MASRLLHFNQQIKKKKTKNFSSVCGKCWLIDDMCILYYIKLLVIFFSFEIFRKSVLHQQKDRSVKLRFSASVLFADCSVIQANKWGKSYYCSCFAPSRSKKLILRVRGKKSTQAYTLATNIHILAYQLKQMVQMLN